MPERIWYDERDFFASVEMTKDEDLLSALMIDHLANYLREIFPEVGT